jgi:hypothetical protein
VCHLHLTFKISFLYLFRPLFSLLGHKLTFTWGSYAAFHGMARKCSIGKLFIKNMLELLGKDVMIAVALHYYYSNYIFRYEQFNINNILEDY